jgi:RNA polymerase sigma factor (sigma-70 family)
MLRLSGSPITKGVRRELGTTGSGGLEEVFLANRERLLRFLKARGAGDAAEDLLQEVWIKIAGRPKGPIASPLSYLFRTADLLMIDRYRATVQAQRRDMAWGEAQDGTAPGVSDEPSAERRLIGQENARLVAETLDGLGPRVSAIFRAHRIEDEPQRKIAQQFGVSLSTVESDLRKAYAALAELKERLDEV